MREKSSSFVTDTATVCIFDLEAISHRLNDQADWWSIPDEELHEVNKGNVAFVGLGCDGRYTFDVVNSTEGFDCVLALRCPSGRVFIGAGEEVTAEGLEPECVRGGVFLNLTPGNYLIGIRRDGPWELTIGQSVLPNSNVGNAFADLIRI